MDEHFDIVNRLVELLLPILPREVVPIHMLSCLLLVSSVGVLEVLPSRVHALADVDPDPFFQCCY